MGETKTITITLVAVGLASFNFTQLEPVKSAYSLDETVYVKYTVKNNGTGPGAASIVVKDLDTGATVATYTTPELSPGYSFATSGTHANVGKMPNKNWRLSFTVTP